MPKLYKLVEKEEIKLLHKVLGKQAELHLVGGCLRDSFLNIDCKDVDLATRFTPEQVIEKLEQSCIKYIPTGIRRGTITAVINNEAIEITTFRNPENEQQFTNSILEDLPARDFTINAIAYSLNDRTIIDPFNGIGDLHNNLVKCVGDPLKRFTEDPHRILRMVRFGIAYGRETDLETYNAAIKLVHLVKNTSMERVNSELVKILCSKYVGNAFLILLDLGILDIFLPELVACKDFEQNKYHMFDVLNHILYVTGYSSNDKLVRLAALFHDIGKPFSLSIDEKGERHFIGHEEKSVELTKSIMTRLKFSNEEIKIVSLLVETHMFPIVCGRKGLRKLIILLGDQLDRWIQLKYADIFSGRSLQNEKGDLFVQEWKDFLLNLDKELCYKNISKFDKLEINGNDLLLMGFKEGPEVGKILKELNELILENPDLNSKEILLEKVKLSISSKVPKFS